MKKVVCLVVITIGMSACSGLEIGTKAWITRVDETQSSQKTYRRAMPWKCYFTQCSEFEPEVQGS